MPGNNDKEVMKHQAQKTGTVARVGVLGLLHILDQHGGYRENNRVHRPIVDGR